MSSGSFEPGPSRKSSEAKFQESRSRKSSSSGVSVHIAIASALVFLSLVLKPTVNHWINIMLPILYIVSIVVSAIGETWTYYYFLSKN